MKFCGGSCNFILKPIVCKDHAVIPSVVCNTSCTAEINTHHTTGQEAEQNTLSKSILWEIEGHRRYHYSKLARALEHIFSPCGKCALIS